MTVWTNGVQAAMGAAVALGFVAPAAAQSASDRLKCDVRPPLVSTPANIGAIGLPTITFTNSSSNTIAAGAVVTYTVAGKSFTTTTAATTLVGQGWSITAPTGLPVGSCDAFVQRTPALAPNDAIAKPPTQRAQ